MEIKIYVNGEHYTSLIIDASDLQRFKELLNMCRCDENYDYDSFITLLDEKQFKYTSLYDCEYMRIDF